jgi:hypothetical protein
MVIATVHNRTCRLLLESPDLRGRNGHPETIPVALPSGHPLCSDVLPVPDYTIQSILPAEILLEEDRVMPMPDIRRIHFGHAVVIPGHCCSSGSHSRQQSRGRTDISSLPASRHTAVRREAHSFGPAAETPHRWWDGRLRQAYQATPPQCTHTDLRRSIHGRV